MIRPRPTLLAATLAALLSGCALGPDYVRPAEQAGLPGAYTEQAPGASADTPALAGRWWSDRKSVV